VRTPKDPNWKVVRNYEEFVDLVSKTGLENIETISLDHDLGPIAMSEYFNNVSPNYKLDYNNLIEEKTGYDCAKWLVDYYYEKYDKEVSRNEKRNSGILFPRIYTHSANPIGSANIMGYVNNFLMNEAQPQDCVRVQIEHTV
jgi:hypothetical protein